MQTDPETDEDAHDGGDRVSADEGGEEDAASLENGVLRLQNGRYVATPESSDLEGEDAAVHGDEGVPTGDTAAFGAFALRERPKLLSRRAGVPDAVIDLLLDEQWASLGPHEREVNNMDKKPKRVSLVRRPTDLPQMHGTATLEDWLISVQLWSVVVLLCVLFPAAPLYAISPIDGGPNGTKRTDR